MAPQSPTPAASPAAPPGPLPGPDAKLRFNFRFQPWKDVLDWFAQQAGLSLVMDAPPPGTFNYTDDREYTAAEAIDLLNSVLLTKGYTLVRRQRMLMLINLQDGIPANLVPMVSQDELDKRGESELVSVLFNVDRLSPEEAEMEIKKLLGPQGTTAVLTTSRQLLVTDTAGRLRAVRNVLKRVDQSDGNTPSQVRTFDLKHAIPQQVMDLLHQMLDLPAGKNMAPDDSIRFALDATSQRLLVSGKPNKLAKVEEILKALDVPDASLAGTPAAGHGPVANSPQLEVYPLKSAEPDSVMSVLQSLMTGLADVRLAMDSKNGSLIALARPEQQATIRATLDQLQREGRRVEVIPLRRVEPQSAVSAISKLFSGGDSKSAPQVDADTTTRQLLVRATPGQMQQIEDLLKKLGEDPSGSGGGGSVRMIPLSGSKGREALERLQELWPTLHQNRIRVVTPSAEIPSIRTGIDDSAPPPAANPPEQPRPAPSAAPSAASPGPSASNDSRSGLPGRTSSPARQAGPTSEKSASWHGMRLLFVSQPAPKPEPKPEAKPQAAPTPAPKVEAKPQAAPTPAPKVEAKPQAAPTPAPKVEAEPKPQSAAAPAVQPVQVPASSGPQQPPEPATIFVMPGPSGIVITSRDVKALDEFEDLLRSLSGNSSASNSDFTIFYLKHAKAASLAETLDRILGGEAASASSQGGRSGGGGMFGSLMGLGGGSASATGPVHITPDSRLNALIVQANAQDVATIERLLRVLDQRESPEEIATAARPRIIPIYNTPASEVADLVKQIYSDRMQGGSSGSQGNRGGRMLELLAMMRSGGMPGMPGGPGGGGGQGRRGGMFPGGAGGRTEEETPKMSIGVDTRANNLIVVAPETLFQEVSQLVEEIDRAAADSAQDVKVVTLERTSVPALQQALSSLTGGAATTSVPAGQGGALAGYGGQRGGYIPPAPQSTGQTTAGRTGAYAGGYAPSAASQAYGRSSSPYSSGAYGRTGSQAAGVRAGQRVGGVRAGQASSSGGARTGAARSGSSARTGASSTRSGASTSNRGATGSGGRSTAAPSGPAGIRSSSGR